MDLLFAFHNVKFAKDLKSNFEEHDGVRVIDIVSSEEDLIEAIAKNPNVKGVLIATDIATNRSEKRLELLVDILEAARAKFTDVVFTVMSNERPGHPLLAELVEMGIYNIFVKDKDEITIPLLMNSFEEPYSFSSAMKYRKVNTDIPWRRNIQHQSTYKIELNNGARGEEKSAVNVEKSEEPKKKFNIKWPSSEGKARKDKPDEDNLENETPTTKEKQVKEKQVKDEEQQDDWLSIEMFTESNKVTEKIIGTVVIGVASVAPHLGSTHTSIGIATVLRRKGHMVALVEANYTSDFDRIHALYEGESRPILHEAQFELNGITHFKYREDQSLADIFALYEFVVLDLGDMESMAYEQEFKRSHVKCVVCSGHEWKFHWIQEFRKGNLGVENIKYVLPNGTDMIAQDMESRLEGLHVIPVPNEQNPYKPSKETELFVENLVDGFLGTAKRAFTMGSLILTSVASILITVLIISAFKFF
ncbi:hypothetical protein MHH81_21025 [Psychrobacillus sp. FSL H8-0484]|uniref:hypothetical protein n=1 Tax=Psychrobacillus sp. FSL H8-0484 TaxID=2921390 RepID=UPI0030F878C0